MPENSHIPAYSVHPLIRLNRLLLRPVFRGLFHLLGQVKIIGKENIPQVGNYIVAINHISLFEPPFIVAFWPAALEAVGAAEIWSKPGQSLLAHLYGGIQVHRGEYDREMIDQVLSVLNSGHRLLIAPEGGRSHQTGLRRGLPGVAYIIEKTRQLGLSARWGWPTLPVIPVGIVGSTDDFFQKATHGLRPPLEMHIGKPLFLPPVNGRGTERRQMLQQNVDQVMLKIAELLPPEYRGIYAS